MIMRIKWALGQVEQPSRISIARRSGHSSSCKAACFTPLFSMLAKSSVQIERGSGHSSSSKDCLFYSTVCTTVFDACTNVTFSFCIFVIYHQSIDTNHQVYKLRGLQSLFYSTVCTKVFLMLVQRFFNACTNVSLENICMFVINHQSIDKNHQVYKLQGDADILLV